MGLEGYTIEGCWLDAVEDDLRKTLGSLVIVEKRIREVRLFHQTLREALLGISKPPGEMLHQLYVSPEQAHTDITIACLDYIMLTFSILKSAELHGQRVEKPEFLQYAAQMWLYHFRQAGKEDKNMLEMLNELAASPDDMEFTCRLLNLDTLLEMGEYMPIAYQLCVFRPEKLAIKSSQELGTKQCQDLGGLL
ncbi:hypothetical protein F4860DRAFT_517660 [Xylaria cubensis]|nr:hypothetical protein F4860DRAFT_517660 [Xylaria cubensis]